MNWLGWRSVPFREMCVWLEIARERQIERVVNQVRNQPQAG